MSEHVSRDKLYAIMTEESQEFREQAMAMMNGMLSRADCTYWLERAAEHFRRYREYARTPPPATAKLRNQLAGYRRAPDFEDCSSVTLHMDGETAAAFLAEWPATEPPQ